MSGTLIFPPIESVIDLTMAGEPPRIGDVATWEGIDCSWYSPAVAPITARKVTRAIVHPYRNRHVRRRDAAIARRGL